MFNNFQFSCSEADEYDGRPLCNETETLRTLFGPFLDKAKKLLIGQVNEELENKYYSLSLLSTGV